MGTILFSKNKLMNHPLQEHEKNRVGFICCIESGFLEEQVLLLAKSIRLFGGGLAQSSIYAICPVPDRRPSGSTMRALESLNVNVVIEDLNRSLLNFPYANKSYSVEYISDKTEHEILVFLDSDTVFIDEPADLILGNDTDFAARPVDMRGICASPADMNYFQYWQQLCELAGIGIHDLPQINTSVDQARIFANYNGGLLVFRRSFAVGRLWKELLEKSWAQGITPNPNNFWGSGQSTLSVAVHALKMRHEVLNLSYNIPVHLIKPAATSWTGINAVHLHYHWLLEKSYFREWKCKIKTLKLGRDANDFLSKIKPFKCKRGESSIGF